MTRPRQKMAKHHAPHCAKFVLDPCILLLLGGIAACSANDSAYSYTFLRSVVCLSVVCHIRAPCLSRWTDLDAIWHVHLRGLTTHCVRWGPCPQKKGRFGGEPPTKTCNYKLHAATWRLETSSYVDWQQRFRLLPNYFGLVIIDTNTNAERTAEVVFRSLRSCAK